MASNPTLGQARELLEWANEAKDDPRRTRLDLLQLANFFADRAGRSREMRDLVADVRDTIARQVVTARDLEAAVRRGQGWPVIEALPGPGSYFFAGLRVAAHGALRRCALVDDFEARLGDVTRLAAAVRPAIDTMGPEWAGTLTTAAADMATEPESRSRLIAAAKDVQQLVTNGELPTWEDFAEGAARSAWPPLTLGICPVSGGAFREDPDEDWDVQATGYGGAFAIAACVAGFAATGNAGLIAACVFGVIVLVSVAALIAWLA
jgi:hypothetical protein